MNIQSNIWKLYVIKTSKWLMLYMPTIVLFFQENGLSLHQVMIIQSIYSITIAALEIPSGYVADVIGRKKALAIGTFFGFAGMCVYSIATGFWGFIGAALCLGIGQSFVSGSDTALMYDSLLAIKKEMYFMKYEGRSISFGNVAEAVGFLAGGALASISLRTPFFFQSLIALVGFVAAILLVEPKRSRITSELSSPWKNIKNIIHYAMIQQRQLRLFVLYSSILGATTLTLAWFVQPYFQAMGMENKFYYGLLGAVLNVAVATTAYYAYRIERSMNWKSLMVCLLLILCGGFFALGYHISLWSLPLLVVFYTTRGIATPVLRDYINRHTPSEMRATVMSIRGFLVRILFASTSPLLGWIADVYSLGQSLMLAGGMFALLAGVTVVFLLKSDPPSPKPSP